MITLYDPRPEGASSEARAARPIRSKRCPPESFLNTIEAQRYEFLAEQFRKLDSPAYAQMCDRFAAEHRETAVRLDALDKRMTELDAKLYPLTKGQGRAAK